MRRRQCIAVAHTWPYASASRAVNKRPGSFDLLAILSRVIIDSEDSKIVFAKIIPSQATEIFVGLQV